VKLSLGCIADGHYWRLRSANHADLSWACAKVQTIGVAADDLRAPEVDAVVVSIKSRSIEANVDGARSRAAETMAARPWRGHVTVKELLDSIPTTPGNIGRDDALRRDAGDR